MIFGLWSSASRTLKRVSPSGTGVERIVPPEQHAGGRRAAGEVGHREIAEGEHAGVDARMEALGEARLAPVRRAERMAEARHPADVMAAGAGAERDRLRAELVADGEQLFGDLVERLVPGDALPRARAARPLAPHRIFQPVRMIDEIERDGADRAQPAVIERRVAVALDLDQAAVAHVQQHAAAAMAAAAHAFEDLMVSKPGARLDSNIRNIHGATRVDEITLTTKANIPRHRSSG